MCTDMSMIIFFFKKIDIWERECELERKIVT